MSVAESSARAVKATRLADAFADLCESLWDDDGGTLPLVPADVAFVARSYGAEGWQSLALRIGVRPPSAETIAVTLRLLELRVEQADDDPFRGLPGPGSP